MLPRERVIDLSDDGDHLFSRGGASECSMCQFFESVTGPELLRDYVDPAVLRVFAADDVFTNLGADKVIFDTNVLSVHNDLEPDFNLQYLWLLGPRVRSLYGAHLLDPGCFDIEATNHWISYCQSNHRATCRLASLPRMQSFQVIDCKTETVIKAPPNCAYVALSYVWGGFSTTDFSSSLSCAPKLILDSIEVTKMLKFRYLWVDRYCIDQSDSTGKHEQICQMDMIYASAQVTIIAAGSEDPNRGLHGVRGTLRISQPTLRLGDHRIVSSLVDPVSVIAGSKWATRGWTYQEGLLSTRRLVFSEDQVRFECNSMHCSEAIHLPLEEMHDKRTGKMDFYAPIGAFQWKDFGTEPWDFMDYVSQFSERKLSFPTDALNAMRGIFNNLEKGRYPVFQLMGVPIMPPYINTSSRLDALEDPKYQRIPRSPGAGFLIGLLWHHQPYGLSVPHPTSRSHIFSSWTWAACSLHISPELAFDQTCTLCDLGAQVSVELPDGSILPFPTDYSVVPAFMSQAQDSKIIHITAKVASCQIAFRRSELHYRGGGYVAVITGDDELTICLEVLADVLIEHGNDLRIEPFLLGKSLTAIIFALTEDADRVDYPVSVIVVDEDSNKNFSRRVGICRRLRQIYLGSDTTSCILGTAPILHIDDEWGPELRKAKQQALSKWVERLPTKTIRLG
ncbi:hypothetical protein CJF31_00010577 [Rutstroemia sp. NJR-2017a BVV2]|nr:hypothetical protein CJF31_00010577 [Rutstroemia sp. NJR-2017a BVV2]